MSYILNLIFTFFVIFSVKNVESFSNGAPKSVCSTLIPGHRVQRVNETSPFKITLDKNEVFAGQKIRVTLSDPDNKTPFKGFFAIGHALESKYEALTPVSVFDIKNDENLEENHEKLVKLLECDEGTNALTHTSSEPKISVVFDWIAPENEGDYVILTTFVKDYATYWPKQSSEKIKVNKRIRDLSGDEYIETTTDSIMNDDAGEVESAPITLLKNEYYAGCGSTKTCFGLPFNCIESSSCEMFTSYAKEGDNFKLQIAGRIPDSTTPLTQGHISSALSFDTRMGSDSVMGCVLQNGVVRVKSYYNIPGSKQNSINIDENEGIANGGSGKLIDRYLFCDFTRTSTFEDKSGEVGAKFDLTKDKFHFMLARSASMSINKENKREKLGYHYAPDDKGVSGVSVAIF